MSHPIVSVVVPTYNHRDFVVESVESALAQTLSAVEIVVVNDGSTDDTADRLAPLAQSGRIVYLEQPNRGPAHARNTGIEQSRGRYIAFLDDDDLLPTDKLEWQTAFLDSRTDVAVVGGTLQLIDESGSLKRSVAHVPDITVERLFSGNPFYSPGQTLIRRDVLESVGGLDPAIRGAEDWDLWFRIAKRRNMAMVDRLALYYRIHPGNASRHASRMVSVCSRTINRHLRDMSRERRPSLRANAHTTIYDSFGSVLARAARREWSMGRYVGAARRVWSLRPIARTIVLDPTLFRTFWTDLTRPPARDNASNAAFQAR